MWPCKDSENTLNVEVDFCWVYMYTLYYHIVTTSVFYIFALCCHYTDINCNQLILIESWTYLFFTCMLHLERLWLENNPPFFERSRGMKRSCCLYFLCFLSMCQIKLMRCRLQLKKKQTKSNVQTGAPCCSFTSTPLQEGVHGIWFLTRRCASGQIPILCCPSRVKWCENGLCLLSRTVVLFSSLITWQIYCVFSSVWE